MECESHFFVVCLLYVLASFALFQHMMCFLTFDIISVLCYEMCIITVLACRRITLMTSSNQRKSLESQLSAVLLNTPNQSSKHPMKNGANVTSSSGEDPLSSVLSCHP